LRELERRRARVEASAAQLRALSPRATLERGYAIVRSDERLVREPPAPGSDLEVEVARGAFAARVH
jgi:exodeoxyribonuclease VII large subunit